MKNIAYIQKLNSLSNEQIKRYMGNIKFLISNDPIRIYNFIVCCNKKCKITNFCLNITSGVLNILNTLIKDNKDLDNCIFVATYSNANYVRNIITKNIYFSLSALSVLIENYKNIEPYNVMTIASNDLTNPFYDQLLLEGPKPAYRINELTVEKMNEFVDNGNSLDLLIALSNSPVNEFEILNKILLDPACKYTNFATFLELLEFDLQYVNKLKSKLVSINNIASNVSINGSIEQYPTINSLTLYDNCSIQLVNSYFAWSFYIKNSIIFNRFINETKNKSSIKKDIKELLSTTIKTATLA
jgi:hypothetical protein